MKKSNIFLLIAGILMLVIGIVHGIGGIQLFQKGNTFLTDRPVFADINGIRVASIGMFVVAILFIICGIGVMLGKRPFWNLSIIAIILYVVDGIVNGQILYGEALNTGVTINITLAIIILVLLYMGKSRVLIDSVEN